MKTYKCVKSITVALCLSLFGSLVASAQNYSSFKVVFQTPKLSADAKMISFDVCLKSIDSTKDVRCCNFSIRGKILKSSIGTDAKLFTVSNGTPEMGIGNTTWESTTTDGVEYYSFLAKNTIPVTTWERALSFPATSLGVRIGTFFISNLSGKAFEFPVDFTITNPDASILKKSLIGIFKERTNTNITGYDLPVNVYSGFSAYSLTTTKITELKDVTSTLYPNPAYNEFCINAGSKSNVLNIFDLNGVKMYSTVVSGLSKINISTFPKGIYMVEINGNCKKLIKK